MGNITVSNQLKVEGTNCFFYGVSLATQGKSAVYHVTKTYVISTKEIIGIIYCILYNSSPDTCISPYCSSDVCLMRSYTSTW